MGLKQDLIDAKIEGLKTSGANDEAISQAQDVVEPQAQAEVDAIVNFLTKCQFRITELNANVILEDFSIPPQQADVLPTVQFQGGNAGGPLTALLSPNSGKNGVLTKRIDVNKTSRAFNTGILQSTGYAFIGRDPDSQNRFDTTDEDGQRQYTTVKLLREDIEDLL